MRLLCILMAVCGMCSAHLWADDKPPNVPSELLGQASAAREQFMRGDYAAAEKTYRQMLTEAPNNLYLLSNLGVVLFRRGKYQPAEEQLKKAIAVDPADEFSHSTLGIVYYSQAKYDDAINVLTKALALNPKSSIACNYLGISASQKGWSEAAEHALLRATLLDARYGDAFFNLAVVYATKNPPDREKARLYYEQAIELGAGRDESIEQIIGWETARGLRGLGDFLTPLEMERRQIPPAVQK